MEEPELITLTEIPDGLFEAQAHELNEILGGPTLIHVPGKIEPALFVSILLHGNETTGWTAISNLLRTQPTLNRSLSLFIGNTAAAAEKVRSLDKQEDYNRCWPGTLFPDTPEARLMRSIVETMRGRGVFASIDIHNNTGSNPIYACTNRMDSGFLALAGSFSDIVVYFTQPKGVQSAAFALQCPAIVLECGRAGNSEGIRRAEYFIGKLLGGASLPQDMPDRLSVYRTLARVEVCEDIEIDAGQDMGYRLPASLETLNFTRLPEGTCFGYVVVPPGRPTLMPVRVRDAEGYDVTSRFFYLSGDELLLRKALTPAMISTNVDAIRKDCLCYLMEPVIT